MRTSWLSSVMSGRTSTPSSFPEPESFNGSDTGEMPGTSARQKHRCLDCDWFGGTETAYAHHAENHHRIVLTYAPEWGPVSFSCCPETALGARRAR